LPISIPQALDLPVAVVLIMFIPIGLWRGLLREWVACAGIALGILLAVAAGARWGDGFAQFANMEPQLGRFAVAAGLFLASVLLLGYGGGLALPYRPDLSWANRGLGALLGLGNGLLIIGGLLRLMQEYLFDGRSNSPLHTAALTTFLIDASIVWVYLGLFLGLLLCVILGLIRRVNDGAPLLEEYSPVYPVAAHGDWASATRREPQPPAPETRSGGAAASVPNIPTQETQVLRLITTPNTATASAPTGGNTPPPASTKQVAPQVANLDRPTPRPAKGAFTPPAERSHDTERVPLIIEHPNEQDAPTPIPRAAADSPPTGKPQQREAASPESAAPPASCPTCGAPLAGKARFCSNCGHVTGAAERRQIAR